MKKIASILAVFAVIMIWLANGGNSLLRAATAESPPAKGAEQAKPEAPQRNISEELMGLEKRRQQLMEREAALSAKEQELNRLAASLDARLKELNAAQKTFEAAYSEKKKKEDEVAKAKYMKMFKLLKAMNAEEAAKIMDTLEEPLAIGLLEKYDQKTVLKLAKYINRPRLLRWIKENLRAGSQK